VIKYLKDQEVLVTGTFRGRMLKSGEPALKPHVGVNMK
jgi:hypothetical protein